MSWLTEHYKENTEIDKIYFNMFFKKEWKILDIGCNTGNFLANCSKVSVGVDIDKDAVELCNRRGLKAIYYNVEEGLPFDDNTFDAVNCRHVIEHIAYADKFLKEIQRILNKGGKCVILTDNLKKVGLEFWHDPTHIKPFIKESLYRLFYDLKWQSLEVYEFSNKLTGIRAMLSLWNIDTIKKFYTVIFDRLIGGNSLIAEAVK